MRTRVNQVYEEYWNYTAALTDFDGDKFRNVLTTIIDFIDEHSDEEYTAEKYKAAQIALQNAVPVSAKQQDDQLFSQRKRINQLVKLGLIKPYFQGYVPEVREFLDAKTSRRRKSVMSRIVYNYANFLNSITDDVQTRQLAFFIKTLEEVGKITDRDLATLMTIDIKEFGKEFATREDIDRQYSEVDVENFKSRKYNQIGHLKNILGKLDDFVVKKGAIYFRTDAEAMFPDDEVRRTVRDPYLQRIYKSELMEESMQHFGKKKPRCMLDGLSHPVLIASHIKPYSHCADDRKAQFDSDNGLLLNKALDSLFDLGYITFNDNGNIIASSALEREMKNYLKQFQLHKDFLNPQRLAYMAYHREHVFEKRFAR